MYIGDLRTFAFLPTQVDISGAFAYASAPKDEAELGLTKVGDCDS